MEGIFLINKNKGISSYDVIRKIKNYVQNDKIGHGGTLDVLAEGLLIIGVGKKYTKKLSEFLKNSVKEYIAEFKLGEYSSTDDEEGEKIKVDFKEIPDVSKIEKILKEKFTGEISQIPPLFSSLKIKGKRLYELARKGAQNITPKERKVYIYSIEILEYQFPILKLSIKCSSGTYIRSIARDLGKELNTGGYVKSLKRIAINDFKAEEAIDIEGLKEKTIEMQARVEGKVQGVGFRAFTKKWAENFNITGYAKNLPDGSVEIKAQGILQNLALLQEKIKEGPSLSKVENTEFLFKKSIYKLKDFLIL